MAMFDDNFSFASPGSPSMGSSAPGTRESSRSVSPFSPAGPYPPPRFSIGDLAAQFADQRIRREAPICYDSCEAYANPDDDEGWAIPPIDEDDDQCASLSRSRALPQRPHSPTRRLQRQHNSRLLCTTSHRRDVEALVKRMVDAEEQCSITPPACMTPVRAEHEDEGYGSSGDEGMDMPTSRRSSVATMRSMRPDFRRSSDYKSATGVCKNVRLRRDTKQHKRIRSSEKSAS